MARQAERPPIISDKYRISINNLYFKLECFPTYTSAYCVPDKTQTPSSIMTPDRSFGRRAGSCLLVLGSVYIQVFTYKWQGPDSIRFTMWESKVILSSTLRESILILSHTLRESKSIPPLKGDICCIYQGK